MSACDKHKANPVKGYRQCAGCEVEALQAERDTLRQQLAEAQSNTDKWWDVACSQRDEADRIAAQRDKLAGLLKMSLDSSWNDEEIFYETCAVALAEVDKQS